MAIASVPAVPAAAPWRVLVRDASTSCHSEAPSSRVHWATGFGRGAPRRRSRSSESSQARSSSSRRLTWWAPRRATLPHPAALRGSGGRSSRSARSVPGPRSSSGRRRGAPVRGGPERGAPVRGGPDLGAADLGAADLGAAERGAPARDAPGRAGPDLGPSVRALADRGRPVWPALLPPERDEAAPPLRPPPARLVPVPEAPTLLVPPGLAGRRDPPLLPAPPDELRRAAPPLALAPREDGRPVPPRLPCPPPPDRVGRADPPARADEARRFGWEEF